MDERQRILLTKTVNEVKGDRATLTRMHGQVWDTEELKRDYEVHAFAAPFVRVTRKRDGRPGVLLFQHEPRFYFGFQESERRKVGYRIGGTARGA